MPEGEPPAARARFERCTPFRALGEEADDSSCPTIEGLEQEGRATLKLVDDGLNDHVIIGGVTETEHHEIALYEGLIENAEAMGESEVVSLLEQNLQDEQAALEKAQAMSRQLAARPPERRNREGHSSGRSGEAFTRSPARPQLLPPTQRP